MDLDGKVVLLDCITLWLTNIFYQNNSDVNRSLTVGKAEWNRFIKQDFTAIVISNELGMGVHPENELARNVITSYSIHYTKLYDGDKGGSDGNTPEF